MHTENGMTCLLSCTLQTDPHLSFCLPGLTLALCLLLYTKFKKTSVEGANVPAILNGHLPHLSKKNFLGRLRTWLT